MEKTPELSDASKLRFKQVSMEAMQPMTEAPSARSFRRQSEFIDTNVEATQAISGSGSGSGSGSNNNNSPLTATKDRILETHINFINQFKKTFELFSKNRVMMNEMKHKFMREIKKLIYSAKMSQKTMAGLLKQIPEGSNGNPGQKSEREYELEDQIVDLKSKISSLQQKLTNSEKRNMSPESDANPIRFNDNRFNESSSTVSMADTFKKSEAESNASSIMQSNPEFAMKISNIEKEIEEN